jgi:hypothetical protein
MYSNRQFEYETADISNVMDMEYGFDDWNNGTFANEFHFATPSGCGNQTNLSNLDDVLMECAPGNGGGYEFEDMLPTTSTSTIPFLQVIPNVPKHLNLSHFICRDLDARSMIECVLEMSQAQKMHGSRLTNVMMVQEDVSTSSWTFFVEKFHHSCAFKINVYRNRMECFTDLEEFVVEGELLDGEKSLFYSFFNILKNDILSATK